jgi:hypothetical protein
LLLLSLGPALTLSSGVSGAGAGAAAVGAAAFGIFAAATAALAVLSATAAPGREGALVAPLVAVFGLLLPFGTAVALSDAFAVAFEPIVASRI